MKKFCTIILCTLHYALCSAGITTYTFTNVNWGSKIGTTVCDGKTDGWNCDKAGATYDKEQTAYIAPFGVKVTDKAAYTGAGATSIKSFDGVRRITFHYGTTTSGRGSIAVKVGNWSIDTTVHIANPRNEDFVIELPEAQSGKITFAVNCTKNSILINSISIRSNDGTSPVFTEATYRLVNDISQLQDSDQIIIGVPAAGRLMGYFNELVSDNNIHSISGKFTENGAVVAENEEAIYTLRKAELKGQACWTIIDNIRYYDAYLVANGGATKNRLAVWDIPTSPNYGDFGYWDITITPDGKATIMNLGSSKGKYLQYNSGNNPTLFGCYAGMSQTAVCLYRRVEAIGDQPAIVAPLVRFDDIAMAGTSVSGSRTIVVNANRLTRDIDAQLTSGSLFTLSDTRLDRDGDELTISYTATEPGRYIDTLILRSGSVETRISVMLNILPTLTIAEAKQMADYTALYLSDVVVTKKFDKYVFVRDETGSMLLFDSGNGRGGWYAQDVQKGDILRGVNGKEWNYYGVPELNLSGPLSKVGTTSVEPEEASTIDSADVCRYVRIPACTITNGMAAIGGQDGVAPSEIPVIDAFKTSWNEGIAMDLDAIVMISHDQLQLWVVGQQMTTGEAPLQLSPSGEGKYLRDGELIIERNSRVYNAQGMLMY